MAKDAPEKALADENVIEAIKRGFIEIKDGKVTYNLHVKKKYRWSDPEEWVRTRVIAFLVVDRGYPHNRLRTEVNVPRRTPNDFADIVVYRDDRCREPYLVSKTNRLDKASRQEGSGSNKFLAMQIH